MQTSLQQTLSLHLSPRILQMLKILSLPYLELVGQIHKEAEENVMLEVERADEYAEYIRFLNSDRKIRKEADFSEVPGLENIKTNEKTLIEHLLSQLELEDLEEKTNSIAKEIVLSIDEKGYLPDYPEIRDKIMKKLAVSRPTVDKALKIVQGFEPDGIAARDLKECLLLQIENYNFESPELEEILTKVVNDHLDDIEKGDLKSIAKKIGVSESGVSEIINYIKNNLTPYPGAAFGSGPRQVIPSFSVYEEDGKYKVISLEQKYGPQLSLSPAYLKMLDDPKTDNETREFLKNKLNRAKDLLEDFNKRGETLEKIGRKIIEGQKDFLEKGILYLVPLSQKSLADEFGLHPSTISRAIAEKFVQTPHGIYNLKFLCPRGPKGVTAAKMKALIGGIIEKENKHAPYSDEKIMELMKEAGINLDRRTVAYYREKLKIPSAANRSKK